ncbi:MAG: SDR family oxidoreductase [Burkholderiales bacterium]|nr:SDR family oxidoreductase [Burkholderiales bacterium]
MPRERLFENQTAVITGAGGAMGQAISTVFAQGGARVVLLDVNAASLGPIEGALRERGFASAAIATDVSEESSVRHAADRVRNEFGGCDILVNNAGILPSPCGIENLSAQEFNRVLTINLGSMFLCTRLFGVHMLAKGRGSIINIGSTAAHSPNTSGTYAVSKAGVLALTRQTAVEWGPRGVRANTVSPGFIRTPLSEAQYTPELYERRIGMIPARRLGLVEDVARTVAFLASEAAAYVSGQEIVVDGGFLQTTLMHAQRPEHQYGGHLHPPSPNAHAS